MDFYESGMLGRILESEDNCMSKVSDTCLQPTGKFPEETPLAMAYVPFQSWEKPYDMYTALSRGTIFQSLDKPFIGEGALCNGND